MLSITEETPRQKQVADYTTYFIQAQRELPDWGLSHLLSQLSTCKTRNEIDLAEELIAQYALGRIKPSISIEGVRWTLAELC